MRNLFKAMAMVAVITAFASTANAQLFITGNVSLAHNSGETERTTNGITETHPNTNSNSLGLGTDIGYYFNDKMAFGAEITFKHAKNKNADDKKIWSASNHMYFNPYFRYDFVSTDKLSIGAKAYGTFNFGKNKNNERDLSKDSEIGFGIRPVMNYKFNSHWSAGLQFGGLGYHHTVAKNLPNPNNDTEYKEIDNYWTCNFTLESLTLSIVYTF